MRNSGLRYPLQVINDELYEVIAEYPIAKCETFYNEIKNWLGCDKVFKINKKNIYIFCRQVETVDIIE